MAGSLTLRGLALLVLGPCLADASARALRGSTAEEGAGQLRYKPMREQMASFRQKLAERQDGFRKKMEEKLDQAAEKMEARFDQGLTQFTKTFNEGAHTFNQKAVEGVDKVVTRASAKMGDAYSKAQQNILGGPAEEAEMMRGSGARAPPADSSAAAAGTEVSGQSAGQLVSTVQANLLQEVQSSLLQAGVEVGELQRLADALGQEKDVKDGPLTRQIARIREKAKYSLKKAIGNMEKPMDRAVDNMASKFDTAVDGMNKRSTDLALYMSNSLSEATRKITDKVADDLHTRVEKEMSALTTPEPAV